MVDFELTAAQAELKDQARHLADTVLRPHAAYWDANSEFPETSYAALCESGLLDVTLPSKYGGKGMGTLEACIVIEQLAHGCMSSAMIAQMFLNGPSQFILRHGTEEQRKRLLTPAVTTPRYWAVGMTEPQAGSSATDLLSTLRPVPGGYRLSGEKCFITGGLKADSFLIFARIEGSVGPYGIGAVVVNRGVDGFADPGTTGKMGSRGVAEANLQFDNVYIADEDVVMRPDGDSKQGAAILGKQFNPERLGNASMCLGVSQAALDAAVDYTLQREQFGRPIAEFQGLQWMVAQMAIKVETARLLVWRAAVTDEDGFPRNSDCAMAKYYANTIAQEVTNSAIQLHGHRGFSSELSIERYFRDVRGMALGGGTTEIMLNVVAGSVFKRSFSQRKGA